MLRKPGKVLLTVLLAAGISVLLSSCLVEKDDTPEVTISRNNDNSLRIYQPNDRIDYDLQAVTTNPPTTQLGTMSVVWTQTPNLVDPITGTDIGPVLKETTTITYVGSTQPDSIVIRYISQDANGKMILHAIDDIVNELFWPYPDPTSFPTNDAVTTPVIFDSPMAIGTSPVNDATSYLIAQCSSNQCNPLIYRYRDDTVNVVGDSTAITTGIGRFSDPFKITFSGGTNPNNLQALNFLGDIRDACGTSSETINHGGNAGVGNLYVFPAIGIIRMENACAVIAGSGDTVLYTATLRNTNISLP